MTGTVLALNAGSSSLKFALFEGPAEAPVRLARGQIEKLATAPVLHADGAAEAHFGSGGPVPLETLLAAVMAWADAQLQGQPLAAIGHRVVHGGNDFDVPVRVDAGVMAALAALSALAPLHQPYNIAGLEAAAAACPGVLQVACFDTGFHHSLPTVATRFGLPRDLHDAGVRRYGFHGLSYAYLAGELARIDPEMAGGRVIAAHLGSGASLCALRGGHSVDTTMGFTALDGLVMGTRCGTLDPGVIPWLVRARGMTADAAEALLYNQSGLLGVSGISADMRVLEASEAPEAAEAIDLFCHRAAREAGALMAALGGIDGLVFTAGIGEHSAPVRAAICARLAWAGVAIDPAANADARAVISTAASRVKVRILPTDEERIIAASCLALVGEAS